MCTHDIVHVHVHMYMMYMYVVVEAGFHTGFFVRGGTILCR